MTRPVILVADPDIQLVGDLQGVAKEYNLQIVWMRDGDHTLDYLVFRPTPVLVVMELRLSGELNGWDLLTWMRRDNGLKDTPVLVVTNATRERAELAHEHHLIALVGKPADPVVVQTLVRETLKAQGLVSLF